VHIKFFQTVKPESNEQTAAVNYVIDSLNAYKVLLEAVCFDVTTVTNKAINKRTAQRQLFTFMHELIISLSKDERGRKILAGIAKDKTMECAPFVELLPAYLVHKALDIRSFAMPEQQAMCGSVVGLIPVILGMELLLLGLFAGPLSPGLIIAASILLLAGLVGTIGVLTMANIGGPNIIAPLGKFTDEIGLAYVPERGVYLFPPKPKEPEQRNINGLYNRVPYTLNMEGLGVEGLKGATTSDKIGDNVFSLS